MKKRKMRPVGERFWEKVDKRGSLRPGMKTRCWEWIAGTNAGGYGCFSGWTTTLAHRVGWELETGSAVPEGLDVLHRCDNPKCVRVSHLFLGTDLDNMRDREAKGRGRQPKGERASNAFLTARDVLAIRSQCKQPGFVQKDAASRYGVSQVTISAIVRNKTWKSI